MHSLNKFDILIAPLWIAYGVTLVVPIRRLGRENPAAAQRPSSSRLRVHHGAVAWMTWRGSDTAKRKDEAKRKEPSRTQTAYKTVTRNQTTQAEQAEKLREVLRTYVPC